MPIKEPEPESKPAHATSAPPLRGSRDPWLLLLLAIYVVFIGTLWWLQASKTLPDLRLAGLDAIGAPGQPVRLQAWCGLDGVSPFDGQPEGFPVRLEFGGWRDGSAAIDTDAHGVATLEISAPETTGSYIFRAIPADGHTHRLDELSFHPPRLYVWDPTSSVIVVALDALLGRDRDWSSLKYGAGPETRPGAVEALERLTATHRIAYLTQENALRVRSVRGWLATRGFPRGPLIGHGSRESVAALEALRSSFPGLAWGVGGTPESIAAFLEAGVPHVGLDVTCRPGGSVRCESRSDWEAVRQLIE